MTKVYKDPDTISMVGNHLNKDFSEVKQMIVGFNDDEITLCAVTCTDAPNALYHYIVGQPTNTLGCFYALT